MLDQLFLIYLFPLLLSLFLCLPYRFSEKLITRLSTLGLLIPAIISMGILLNQGIQGQLPYERELFTLELYGHVFKLTVWIDSFSIVMLLLTHTLGLLVVKFSHGYLHLEKGYQRFFSTISFFIFGMYVLSLAGTMDMFFAGWEIVGSSSFFLIAFYRDHNRSVINAWRVYNIYRVCDVGLLMGAVLGHGLWHHATRFSEIDSISTNALATIPHKFLVILSSFLVLASLGKSAQFPFHNWPSKAMEGPTPSSAIFYGALSIHAGVFLLVRSFPLWSYLPEMRIIIFVIGLITFILSSLQGRVQANIKGQIAFATTAQIGLMFIELSFGLVTLAMIHLSFHALYRCFQLLVSSSVVASSLTLNNKVTLDRLSKKRRWGLNFLPERLAKTIYLLALNDFSMDSSGRGFHFIPWKQGFNLLKKILAQATLITISSVVIIFINRIGIFKNVPQIGLVLSFLSLFFSLRALFIRNDPFKSMCDLSLSLGLDMISIFYSNPHALNGIKIFLLSVIPALVLGLFVTSKFKNHDLRYFHAKGSVQPHMANLFLISFMILAGMPVSTAFFGEDVIIEELLTHSLSMAFFTTVSLIFNGLICVRIYTRLFMGRSSRFGAPVLNDEG